MRVSLIIGALLWAALVTWAPPAQAGPWTKSLGQAYVKLGESIFISGCFRDSQGQTVCDQTSYAGFTTSAYFEVGIWDRLQVWGYLPYTVAQNKFADTGRKTLIAGGGDAKLGLQYTPVALPLPYAARLELKLPFYKVSDVPDGFAAAGDGQLDLTFWLSAGASLQVIPLFFYAEVGYQLRTEAFIGDQPVTLLDGKTVELSYNDGFTFYLSVGYKLFGKYIISVNSGGVIPYDAGDFTKGYVTVGPALYIPIWKGLAAEASFDPMVYTNSNASPGLGFSVGVSYAL